MKKLLTFLVIISFAYLVMPLTSIAQNQTELWGMTSYGGNGGGVIFKTDGNGNNQQVVKSFIDNPGASPSYSNLCETPDGKLYGMTSVGGANYLGTIFEYNPATGIVTKKMDFDGASKGSQPQGSLTKASNGKLYGMTTYGGVNNKGVLFEYNPTTSTYVKKIDFAGTTNGSYPLGSLIQASNGKLYGMTFTGGVNNLGVIFEYDITTSTYTKKLDFNGAINGCSPYGTLMQASNGKLYGMATDGGASNLGVLFEYDITNSTYTKKFDFAGTTTGGEPCGALIQLSNGKLYGLALNGGTNNFGVIFEYNITNSTYTKKIEFVSTTNGITPHGSLIQATNGKLYGTTYMGGASDKGVIFEYDTSTNVCIKKLDFAGTTNGAYPVGSLIQALNGKLYGMTVEGGEADAGVLFEYDIATTAYSKIDFNDVTKGTVGQAEKLGGNIFSSVNI